jgi:hypothetical protein
MAHRDRVGAGADDPAVAAEPVARADVDLGARVAAADAFVATRPGVVGYVLRDRKTGAV